MVGRLIEEQQVGIERQCECKRAALALAAGGALGCDRRGQVEALEVLGEPRLDAPAFAIVVQVLELSTQAQACQQVLRRRQLRLLLDGHDVQAVAPMQLPFLERDATRDHA